MYESNASEKSKESSTPFFKASVTLVIPNVVCLLW